MKKNFYLVLLLLGVIVSSCYDDDIDNINNRLNAIENTQIASIQQQMSSIESSIVMLTNVDRALNLYIETIEKDLEKDLEKEHGRLDSIKNSVENLKIIDKALENKITELQKYIEDELSASTDWVTATFATLEHFNALAEEVASLKNYVDYKYSAMSESITALEVSMQDWINDKFTGYYTIAEIEAKLEALKNEGKDTDNEIKKDVKALQEDVYKAQKELTEGYQKAITEAINSNNGVINTKIANEINAVNTKIADLEERLEDIESRLSAVEDAIEQMRGLNITFDTTEEIACMAGTSVYIEYTVSGGDAETAVEAWGDGGWSATVISEDATRGKIKVTAPNNAKNGKVVVLATSGAGGVKMKSLYFTEGILTDINDTYEADCEACTLKVVLQTNLNYSVRIPEYAQEWIALAQTRATVRTDSILFNIAENPNTQPRTATIELVSECGDLLQTFDIIQEQLGIAAITPDIYLIQPTKEGVYAAIDTLQNQYRYFSQCLSGIYMMRGGKEGQLPGEHAYQSQYSLGPDLYAQYFTVPHKDFMYGTLTSTYNISPEFNSRPLGAYTMAKDAFMPLLHHPMADSIPEIKAINLLYYSLIAQENADLSGPYAYTDDKKNRDTPKRYDSLKTIYYGIVNDLDNIVGCLKHFETRPNWYKEIIQNIVLENFATGYNLMYGDMSLNSYIKFANSLKLRMAMHIVKVEPATAQKWAEEAVASGVIEYIYEQHGIFPMIYGFTHPLANISNGWGDLRLCASFESLMMSLDHPYSKYLFKKNSNDIPHKNGVDVLKANTRICGIRAGILVGDGQTYALNKRLAYSSISTEALAVGRCPAYFVKWSEVDFLRAEGALRGWNMGGTAQEFYERGIQNAFIEDPICASPYLNYVYEYMQREEPVAYTNVDPMGDGEDWESVTKIGVKWNEADDNETKLEKIITQKYFALFPLSTEAWAEMRRTGYPKMFPVLNPDDGDGSIKKGEMIRRIPWVPTDPIAINIINTSGIPALGGPDKQATRLWWDVDAPNF